MISRKLIPVLGVVLALGVTSPAFTAPPSAETAIAAHGIRTFGFELFRSLYDAKGNEPVAISPLSISEAMSLVTTGAEKETLGELESLFGTKSATLTRGVQGLRSALTTYAKNSSGAFEFTSANALWGNSNPEFAFKFKPAFLNNARSAYGATLHEENFKAKGTVDNINAWVAKNTKDKIKKLVTALKSDDVAVLLNAIYAKGKFLSHFGLVKEGNYTDANGKASKASYLSQNSHGGYYAERDLQAVSLPIGDFQSKVASDQIALDILVPAKGKMDALVASLNGAKYADIISKLKRQEVRLSITAGKVQQGEPLSLTKPLTATPFRLARPFSPETAQFGLLGETSRGHRLFISDVVTKTFYEVTPFGFEAAAATAVLVGAATAVPKPPPVLTVNGPSIHVIRHVPTGTPLFISMYDSPVLYDEAKIVELMEVSIKTQRFLSAQTAAGTIHPSRDKDGKPTIVLSDKDGNEIKVLKTL